MRKSKIRQKLDAGQVARVCALGAHLPYYPQMAAHFSYDAVWVDGEHRAWDPHEISHFISRHHLADIDCAYRPPTVEKTGLSRLLEDGVTALIIPQINTVEEARQLAQSTRFPPVGERGLDGSGLDGGFKLHKTAHYPAEANHETLLIPMIETPLGLKNAAEIIAVPGVDALLMGPGDLSLRLGCVGSIRDPQILEAAQQMAAACAAVGKPWGFPVKDIEEAKIVVDMGCRIVVLGNEFTAVQEHLKEAGAQLQQLLGP